MKSFIALMMIMAVVPKPTLQSYWSKRKVIETSVFTEVMSFKRYKLLMRFLHFADDAQSDPRDKLKKIRAFVTFFNEKFQKNYIPNQGVSVDESLMKFRGRLAYIQFNRTKRARFGIKFFKLCESQSGYCSSFQVYTGKKEVEQGVMVSELVVMEMMNPILDKGYICHIDNWYSSPNLARRLLERDTYTVGTVRVNRKHMPTDLKRGKDLAISEAERRSYDGVLVIKSMDRKNVYCISTRHACIDYQPTGKYVPANRHRMAYEVMKPKCIVDYNKGMLGVDRQDQVLSYDPIMRRYSKGYKKIFFYIFDICILNSYVAYRQIKGEKKMHYVDFKTNLAEQLLGSVEPRLRISPGRPSTCNISRLQGHHFLMTIPPTANKATPTKRCVVCKMKNMRKESRLQCKQCVVGIHLECFEAYHTLTKYW
uniref:PiggyBac transposable element-derived protein domain-containing protein n=1 Tax=Graphocephala atropunctata TaxID=36148 RepID=A0A1B6KBZ7_9HEMI